MDLDTPPPLPGMPGTPKPAGAEPATKAPRVTPSFGAPTAASAPLGSRGLPRSWSEVRATALPAPPTAGALPPPPPPPRKSAGGLPVTAPAPATALPPRTSSGAVPVTPQAPAASLPGPSPFASTSAPPRASALPGFETETIARSELRRLRRSRVQAWLMTGGLVALLGAAGYFGLSHISGQRADIARLRSERGAVERKTAEARRDAESQQSTAAALEQKLAAWKPFADEAARKVSEKQELDKAAAQLLGTLKPELEGLPVETAAADGRVILTLPERALFAAGQPDISLDGYRVMFRLVKPLKTITGRNAVIVVTTNDPRPRPKTTVPGAAAKPTGWDLAAARAVGVARFLVDDVGWDMKRVTVLAPAPEKPRKAVRGKPSGPRVEIRLEPPAPASKA